MIATWVPTYSPATPVVITAAGATVTVKNELVCNPPPPDGTRTITKVCDPAVEVPGPVKSTYTSACHITVTTTGPQSGIIDAYDNLSGGGTLGTASAPAPWVCTYADCKVNGAQLNQTSSSTVIDVTVGFSSAGQALESKNCGTVTNGTDGQQACTGFTVDGGKTGSLTITKDAIYDSNHVPNVNFPIAVTCGGTTTNGNVQDGVPYTQNNIPLGTQCSVVETTIPQTGLCPKGQTERWDTSYTPTTPVTVTNPTGTTIAIVNKLNCEPIVIESGWIDITKKFDDQTPKSVGNVAFDIAYDCGQGPNTVSLHSGESQHVAPLPLNSACVVTELPISKELQAAAETACGPGVTPVWTTTYDPEQKVTLAPGASVVVYNTLTCKGQDIIGVDIIKKVVAPKGVDVGGLTFSIGYDCGHGQQNTNPLGNGQSAQTQGSVAGVNCHIQENPFNANPCGKGQTPRWSTTYVPAQDIIAAAGASVTVTNTVVCETIPPLDSDMYVKKVVVNHAPLPLTGMVYDITSQCANTTQPTGFAHFSDGQTVLFHHYEAGMTCNLSEVIATPTTACGNDKPVWTTTYSTTNPVVLSPNGETVTVTNTLDCKHVDNPVGGNPIKVKKVVINNAPAPVGDLQFPITVTCVKGTNGEVLDTDATHTVADGQTVDYLPYAEGFTCSAHEGTIPQTNACGKQKPVWTTAYATQPVPMTTAGETITVTNEVHCEPIKQVPIVTEPPVKVDVPPIVIIPHVLNCDERTTKLVNGQCRCTIQGMVPVSKTSCACPDGTSLKGGACRNEPPPPPVCRGNTHLDRATGRCVENELICPPKTHKVGRRCVADIPDCPRGTHWNGRRCEPNIPNCPRPSKWNGKRCVEPQQPPHNCPDGMIKVGRACIPMARNCPLGTIPTPLGCISIGIGGGGKPPVDGPRQIP
jgi:hypothetical protein